MAITKEEIYKEIKERVQEKQEKNTDKIVYKASVPTDRVLDYAIKNGLDITATSQLSFSEALQHLDRKTKELYEGYEIWREEQNEIARASGLPEDTRKVQPVSEGSLNNCHGRWTEAMFDALVWNVLYKYNSRENAEDYYVYVKMPVRQNHPNESAKKKLEKVWTSLLGPIPQENIELRKQSLRRPEGEVKLESSNPDAIILKLKKTDCSEKWNPATLYEDLTEKPDKSFKAYKGKVLFDYQLIAFLSVKTSTRSDRRYQFIVEGNSTKGLYAAAFDEPDNERKLGVLMRNKYYAFSLEKEKDADHEVLDGLIMFASLFNEAAVGYVRAIDEFNNCEKPAEVIAAIERILSNYIEE